MSYRDNDHNVIRYERFTVDLTDLVYFEPMCYSCKHWNDQTSDSKCTAFGDAPIPWDIRLGNHDYHFPFPGDQGILYDLVEGPPA